MEVILNDKTNEVLVIGNEDLDAVGMVAIYRSAKEKKNSHETE